MTMGIQERSGCEQAIALVERLIGNLHQRGSAIVQEHWDFIYKMDQKFTGWNRKSRLQVRCIMDGNSIRADWCEIRWHGLQAKGNREARRRYIGKPKDSHLYTLSKLTRLAREWEVEQVEKTETSLAQIRREANHLVKALMYLRHAKKVVDGERFQTSMDD